MTQSLSTCMNFRHTETNCLPLVLSLQKMTLINLFWPHFLLLFHGLQIFSCPTYFSQFYLIQHTVSRAYSTLHIFYPGLPTTFMFIPQHVLVSIIYQILQGLICFLDLALISLCSSCDNKIFFDNFQTKFKKSKLQSCAGPRSTCSICNETAFRPHSA